MVQGKMTNIVSLENLSINKEKGSKVMEITVGIWIIYYLTS